MPYNTLIQRSDVSARIPSRISNLMLTSLQDSSAALRLATRIPLPAGVTTFPVLSALPTAYWVTGDTGMKQTSTAAWQSKTITVDELAVIVPVPENVLDDADFDIWGALRPLMETAISRAIDQAVFLGVNKPAGQPVDISTAANAAGNSVVRGTAAAVDGGVAKDISDLIVKLEDDGIIPTAASPARACAASSAASAPPRRRRSQTRWATSSQSPTGTASTSPTRCAACGRRRSRRSRR
jgi:HK97 family phage major capsid protein